MKVPSTRRSACREAACLQIQVQIKGLFERSLDMFMHDILNIFKADKITRVSS
jgi:hypothetical protein